MKTHKIVHCLSGPFHEDIARRAATLKLLLPIFKSRLLLMNNSRSCPCKFAAYSKYQTSKLNIKLKQNARLDIHNVKQLLKTPRTKTIDMNERKEDTKEDDIETTSRLLLMNLRDGHSTLKLNWYDMRMYHACICRVPYRNSSTIYQHMHTYTAHNTLVR